MAVSIPQFDPKSIERLAQSQEAFLRDPSTMAEFFLTTRDEFLRMGLDFITQTLNSCDEMLRGSAEQTSVAIPAAVYYSGRKRTGMPEGTMGWKRVGNISSWMKRRI